MPCCVCERLKKSRENQHPYAQFYSGTPWCVLITFLLSILIHFASGGIADGEGWGNSLTMTCYIVMFICFGFYVMRNTEFCFPFLFYNFFSGIMIFTCICFWCTGVNCLVWSEGAVGVIDSFYGISLISIPVLSLRVGCIIIFYFSDEYGDIKYRESLSDSRFNILMYILASLVTLGLALFCFVLYIEDPSRVNDAFKLGWCSNLHLPVYVIFCQIVSMLTIVESICELCKISWKSLFQDTRETVQIRNYLVRIRDHWLKQKEIIFPLIKRNEALWNIIWQYSQDLENHYFHSAFSGNFEVMQASNSCQYSVRAKFMTHSIYKRAWSKSLLDPSRYFSTLSCDGSVYSSNKNDDSWSYRDIIFEIGDIHFKSSQNFATLLSLERVELVSSSESSRNETVLGEMMWE